MDSPLAAKHNLHYDSEKKLYRVGTSDSYVDIQAGCILNANCIDDIMTHVEPTALTEQFKLLEYLGDYELIGKPMINTYASRQGTVLEFKREYKIHGGNTTLTVYYDWMGSIMMKDSIFNEALDFWKYFGATRMRYIRYYATKLKVSAVGKKEWEICNGIRNKLIENGTPTDLFDSMHFIL